MKRKSFVLLVLGVLSVPGLLVAGYRILDTTNPAPPDLVIEGLHPAIKVKGWRDPKGEPVCNKVVRCGALVAVSCRPEADGELDYFNNTSGELIMRCGGHCVNGRGPASSKSCEVCPPKEWTCERIMPGP